MRGMNVNTTDAGRASDRDSTASPPPPPSPTASSAAVTNAASSSASPTQNSAIRVPSLRGGSSLAADVSKEEAGEADMGTMTKGFMKALNNEAVSDDDSLKDIIDDLSAPLSSGRASLKSRSSLQLDEAAMNEEVEGEGERDVGNADGASNDGTSVAPSRDVDPDLTPNEEGLEMNRLKYPNDPTDQSSPQHLEPL
eukprot:gene10879-13933_t